MQKLGFGMMRLPTPDPGQQDKVDMEKVCAMVDTFLERGFTYFDTAYMYHGGESEAIVREAVVKRHPRDSFTIADKMPLVNFKADSTPADQEKVFFGQLEKCGVDYFDYYLLHNVNAETYATAQRLDTFAFLKGQREAGKLRHLGFSYHDKAELLDQILTNHPEVEFVQLQLNYLDWEDERIQSRKCYETVVRHGKKVVVMEPVKGGRLASVHQEVADEMKALHTDWSPASWAIRFAASQEAVMVVLSGMSTMEQVLDNTGYMRDPAPLTGEERAVLTRAAAVISALPAVACTACRYCVDGCPRSIPIPDYFALYNRDQLVLRQGGQPDKEEYRRLAQGRGLASACVNCRQCVNACPQHLPVVDWLRRTANLYEK